MKIAVYLGSNPGSDPAFQQAAADIGDWIGRNSHELVYGGAHLGLMDIAAQHVLANGGHVIGVMPEFMIERGRQRDDLTQLIVTKDMSSRKKTMMVLADAYIALPGGPGTLEEITEVMSKVSLKHLDAPCILYNLNGYYDDLKALLNHMIEKGLSSKERQEGIYFVEDLDDIKRILKLA